MSPKPPPPDKDPLLLGDQGQVVVKQVKPHSPPFQPPLPPDLQAMIGKQCNCDDCPPDPRISCQYDGSPVTYVVTAYIQNARKGDLLLCPGGGGGIIGGLLHALDPPQHYSHMGIMTKNFYWVRHSCGIDDRLTADEYATGSIFGTPAPLSGFKPDHLRFAWPGTLTQTVDQAYLASIANNTNANKSIVNFVKCSLVDQDSAQNPKTDYNINALGFDPIFDSTADTSVFKGDPSLGYPPGTVFPLIVKVCGLLETDEVRQTLHQVADAAMNLFGHYRFFCYTDPTIALSPLMLDGPAADMANPDPVAAFPGSVDPWFPSDPSNPQPTTVHVSSTIPSVCSSFAWLAVQRVSLPNWPSMLGPGTPQIVLDASTENKGGEPPPIAGCPDEVPPNWASDVSGLSLDGLYIYDNTNRQRAAQWLHDKVRQKVIDKMEQKLPGPLLTLVQLFGIVAITSAAEAGGPAGVAALLVIDSASGANLYEALYDMPNDVADQMCNAFASDFCEADAADSDNWQNVGSVSPDHFHVTPPRGVAVSPDNTMLWDPPMASTGLTGASQTIGLYGHNEKAIFRVGTFPKYSCTWQPSYGSCTLQGYVTHNGAGVNGAVVYAGCNETTTQDSWGGTGILPQKVPGFFSMQIPSGRYMARATATGQNGWGLDGQADTQVINAGDTMTVYIVLQDPPPERRIITVTGNMFLTDYYVGFSSPDQKNYGFNCPPLFAEVSIQGPQPTDIHNNVVMGYSTDTESMSDLGDDTSATLEIWIDAINYNHTDPNDPTNLSIDGHWKYSLPDDNLNFSDTFHVDKDGSYTGHSFLDSGGTFPDSAKLDFTINNMRAP
ncbi:MAG: hypothetical protein OK455_10150 [Thaumarchaeota archaeon]|nr:hypothetical protein [Nitrososphaerota archaeon]